VLVGRLAHPGKGLCVTETEAQVHHHRHTAPDARYPSDHVGPSITMGHEVSDLDLAVGGDPAGHEDEGIFFIPSGRRQDRRGGSQQPAAVVFRAEQRTEGGGGVEPGKAEPVDAAVAPDECRSVTVSDQGVVLNAQSHGHIVAEVAYGHG